MGGSDSDLFFHSQVRERAVNRLHCGKEIRHQLGVVGVKNFVPHRDAADPGPSDERLDVLLDPVLSLDGVGHVQEVLIPETDDEIDSRTGEGREDVGIGIVELHLGDVEGPEEDRYTGWGREVVGYLAVVDSKAEADGRNT